MKYTIYKRTEIGRITMKYRITCDDDGCRIYNISTSKAICRVAKNFEPVFYFYQYNDVSPEQELSYSKINNLIILLHEIQYRDK